MVQYRKISDVSPGLILFQRHFFEAYNGGEGEGRVGGGGWGGFCVREKE